MSKHTYYGVKFVRENSFHNKVNKKLDYNKLQRTKNQI